MQPLPWIKILASLPSHPKSRHLGKLTKERRAWTHYVELLLWVSQAAPDGDLSQTSDEEIGLRAGWVRNPAAFTEALRTAGFLDPDGRIHDWDEYQEAHANRIEKERARSRARRLLAKRVNRESEPVVDHPVASAVDHPDGPPGRPPGRPPWTTTLDDRADDRAVPSRSGDQRIEIEEQPPRARAPDPAPSPPRRGAWRGMPHEQSSPGAQAVLKSLWQAWHDWADPEGRAGAAYSYQVDGDPLARALRSAPLDTYPDPVQALLDAYAAYRVDPLRTGPGKLGKRRLHVLLRPDNLIAALDQWGALQQGVNPHAVAPAPKGPDAGRRTVPASESTAPGDWRPEAVPESGPADPEARAAHVRSLIGAAATKKAMS